MRLGGSKVFRFVRVGITFRKEENIRTMREQNQPVRKLFLTVSTLGALFVLTEAVFQYFGSSLCFTEGCKVTAQYTRFGDISILFIGLLTFLSLALLSICERFYHATWTGRLINLILIVALACEGFLIGYLMFRIHTFCLFCVIIFGFMVMLGLLRLLTREWEMLAGFAAMAAVFGMLYLVLPAGGTVSLPENERLVLFYSKECKHCAEIMDEIQANKVAVKHVEVNGYSAYLKGMGIESVPTLYVNDKYQKVFLTGTEAIRRYLFLCSESQKQEAEPKETKPKTKSGKIVSRPTMSGTGMDLDIFRHQGIIPPIEGPAADEGMCKQNEICK